MTAPQLRAPAAQRGVTLIIVMIILVVVTILGIGGAQLALQGERSTRFDRDYLIASQAAEAALIDAEFDIRGVTAPATPPPNSRSTLFAPGNGGYFVAGCGTASVSATSNRGLCAAPADAAKPIWATVDFTNTSATAPTVGFGDFTGRALANGSGVEPAQAPRYIIELVDDTAPGGNAGGTARPKMYRITAVGFGPNKNVQVVLQTAFRKEQG